MASHESKMVSADSGLAGWMWRSKERRAKRGQRGVYVPARHRRH